jgi:hypothetical protein
MSDFFDLPDEKFVQKNQSGGRKTDENIYNPDPDKFNGKYDAIVRYIPYIHDKSLSKLTKYSAKFYNPLTKEALWLDCPSNVGKPSILWDIETVIKGLKEEEPTLHDDLKGKFSRWNNHMSPVYIKRYPQRPDLEGQIKFFKFSYTINEKIEDLINPEEDELTDNVVKINPYHLLSGKDFTLKVRKKTRQFRDWDKCKFDSDVTPLVYKIGDTVVTVENSEKSVKLISEFLKKNTPKIDEYLHREWTEETYGKVAEAIITLLKPKAVLDRVLDRTKDEKMKALIQEKLGGQSSTPTSNAGSIDSEPIEFEETVDEPIANSPEPTIQDEPQTETPSSETSDEPQNEQTEYDALFEKL